MTQLVVWYITSVAKHNHIGLRAVASLADFADSGIMEASVGTTATGRCLCCGVELCWFMNLAARFCFDALHREFFFIGVILEIQQLAQAPPR